jgi:hypothetical protein
MHQYYTGMSVDPPPAYLRRRSRLTRTRPVMYQPPVRNPTRPTIPLSSPSKISQNTYFPKRGRVMITTSLSPGRRTMPGTDPLLPSIRPTRNPTSQTLHQITEQDTNPTLPFELEDDPSLRYQITRIARGIWQLLKDVPPGKRSILALLGLGILIVLSWILNALGHFIDQFTNPLYIYSGITASAIVIYEFSIKKSR